MYLETVGRNATLILNLPPDKSGSLPPATVNVMTDLGKLLTKRLGTDLARNAKVTVSEERKAGAARNYVATNLTDDNKDTYWVPNDGTTTATITLQWDEPHAAEPLPRQLSAISASSRSMAAPRPAIRKLDSKLNT